jgi:hypothetical protein
MIVDEIFSYLAISRMGIAFISQNKNRLMSFRRKLFVPGHFEPVIEPTNPDALDTQLVKRRPVLLLLYSEEQFSTVLT